MTLTKTLLLLVCLPWTAFAEADGPDYFKIQSNKPVPMFDDNSHKARIIKTLPKDATDLRNLGCEGIPSFAEWEKMNPEQRKKANCDAWCKVSYQGITGWIQHKYLREEATVK